MRWCSTPKMPVYIIFWLFVSALFFFSISTITLAQTFGIPGGSVSLTRDPQYSSPYSETKVSLDDYSVNAVGATIAWYVDGVEQKEYTNERSLMVQAGAIGKKRVVKVVLTKNDGEVLTHTTTILPVMIDLILEANTYTPTFYSGRSLPSGESLVRAVAIVHDGTGTSEGNYVYEWSLDGTVLFGGPLTGGNTASFQMPRYDNGIFAVKVSDRGGMVIGKKSIRLVAQKPTLYFYEENPLRGLSQKALSSPVPLIGEEITVYGIPYFMNTARIGDDVEVVWEVAGIETTSNTDAQNAIVLRREGLRGVSEISLSMITKTTIPQVVKKVFRVFFNEI